MNIISIINKAILFTFGISILILQQSLAQVPVSNLFEEIAKMDSLSFAAFNDRDLERYMSFYTDDVEFYHDQSGLTTPKSNLRKDFKILFRSGRPTEVHRELVKGTMKVYPLADYGAVEYAEHRLFEVKPNGEKDFEAIAKIYVIWEKLKSNWKISRIVSYDHSPPAFKDSVLYIMDKYKIPNLAISIIDGGKISKIMEFERGTDQPTNKHTIFNVASMTKPVTAMLTLKLVENGNLGLDEKLAKYWIDKDLDNTKYVNEITPEVLLSHKSGFSNWRGTNKLKFEFEPGTKFQYSGEGFEYLRESLERKYNTSLSSLADSLIFRPLDMSHTSYIWKKDIDSINYSYEYRSDGTRYDAKKRQEANAADDLLTTIEDYTKFGLAVMNGFGLSNKLIKNMVSPHAQVEGKPFTFGLGWAILSELSTNEYALVHTGADKGTYSTVVLLPESKRSIIIFTNSDNGRKAVSELLPNNLDVGAEIVNRLE